MSMQELGDDTPSRDGEHHQSVMMHRFLKHLHPSSAPLTPAPSVPEDDGHTHTHASAVWERRWLTLCVNRRREVVQSGAAFFRRVK